MSERPVSNAVGAESAGDDNLGVQPQRPFVNRLRAQNYKSIKACDVRLGSLAILVGPNGSGKSNVLDALRFITDSLATTLDHALRDRGGISEVRRRSGGHPNHFAIRIDFQLLTGHSGHYSFRVGAQPNGGFQVTDEECLVHSPELGQPDSRYRVRAGLVVSTVPERLPAAVADRLFLVSASSVEPFRAVYDALRDMGFYNLSPAVLRQLQQPDPGLLLRRDGSNLASVLGHLEQHNPVVMERITDYLQRLSPGVQGVAKQIVGPMETIEFQQVVAGQQRPWRFGATNMSDGTLRGLGVLIALLQSNSRPPTLVGIEEPEVALHPAAVGVLIDAIRDAALSTQVLVTSHSPELLDRDDIGDDVILAVQATNGITTVGPVDDASRSALRSHLFTPGELLRMDQLVPSPEAVVASRSEQPRLFDAP